MRAARRALTRRLLSRVDGQLGTRLQTRRLHREIRTREAGIDAAEDRAERAVLDDRRVDVGLAVVVFDEAVRRGGSHARRLRLPGPCMAHVRRRDFPDRFWKLRLVDLDARAELDLV